MNRTAIRHTVMATVLMVVMIVIGLGGLLMSSNAFTSAYDFMPSDVEAQGITYITGGIGESESNLMKALAPCYQLEIVLIQRSTAIKNPDDEDVGKEEYLADIKIKIEDHHLNNVLEAVSEGPYFLADLPAGKYQITADYNGSVKQQWVTIDGTHHQRVVFWWPI